MDDVRWFERAAVLQAIRQPSDAGLRLPPPTAIAHTLIRAWALDEV